LSNAGILHLQTNNHLNAEKFVPKTIFESPLKQYEQPIVIGFPGIRNPLQYTVIPVLLPNSTLCDANFPSAFCTNHTRPEVRQCGGYLGSGVFDGAAEPIKGLIIRDGFCSPSGEVGAYFHDLSDYREWILENSGAERTLKISFAMILVAVLMKIY
jgi:hypothetical protein